MVRAALLYLTDVSVLPSERQTRVDDTLGRTNPEPKRSEPRRHGDKAGLHRASFQDVVVFSDGLPGPITEGRHNDFMLKHEVVAFLC